MKPAVSLVLMLAFITAPAIADDAGPPSVVLIMADDLGADAIACYGGESAPTPHIDALAASGIRSCSAILNKRSMPTR